MALFTPNVKIRIQAPVRFDVKW
uniref:Uncharacterized protein n=1 Tax=Anguilla anguilla TaxID=7936 RepID=A0A0E9RWA2_ANGAN